MRTLSTFFVGLLWTLSAVQAAEKPVAKTPPALDVSPEMLVYRSPSCGCCGKWLEHVKSHNFNVVDKLLDDVKSIKAQHGVTPELASCHTALVNGYVVEGHVPAEDIKKLLASKPPVLGIAAPGMPVGSPGMEMGTQQDVYNVVSFDKNQQIDVFNQHGAK